MDQQANRYGGRCKLCKQTVHPFQGFTEHQRGRWVVKHLDCRRAWNEKEAKRIEREEQYRNSP